MGMPLSQNLMQPDEFLAWVQQQSGRFEYARGEVFAMGGGTPAHSRVAANVIGLLSVHLKGTGCCPYTSDMAVRVDAEDALYFPDVSVSCEKPGSQLFLSAPSTIFEVLSPSTEAFDRGRKFRDYGTLPALQEYVLIDPEIKVIEVFRRQQGDWLFHAYAVTDVCELRSLDLVVASAEFFVDIY